MVLVQFSELGGSGREIVVPSVGRVRLEILSSIEIFLDTSAFASLKTDSRIRGLVAAGVLGWTVVPESDWY